MREAPPSDTQQLNRYSSMNASMIICFCRWISCGGYGHAKRISPKNSTYVQWSFNYRITLAKSLQAESSIPITNPAFMFSSIKAKFEIMTLRNRLNMEKPFFTKAIFLYCSYVENMEFRVIIDHNTSLDENSRIIIKVSFPGVIEMKPCLYFHMS
ncbi:hypothetical protein AVEN_127954-1 [Araneus ventricosus]|uniref:Uncharacterized protein n=1 Tax=Araneus ventricosus TaxID=182803 RepID=A0A4Y2A028_ARAVE|nr:hypothetical protein AVEN_127954-1 [Araneus ventricosus]